MEKNTVDMNAFTIRFAGREDAALLAHYIRQLAEFEGELDRVTVDKETLETHMFDRGTAEAIVAEFGGKPVGFALFHNTFSTFLGKPGIALVDLYIEPEVRSRGFGRKMLTFLAKLTEERDCHRLEWWVHDWNEDAARFYRKHGAEMVENIRVYRLSGDALTKFAKGTDN